MAYWLMKSEPETWSWQQQQARGSKGELWDGVRNHQAANFMREMAKGDSVFFYHSGKERAIVGVMTVSKTAAPDPTDETGKFVAVTVVAKESLARSVILSEIKADPIFDDFLLVRHSRLSVMPVSDKQWRRVLQLSQS